MPKHRITAKADSAELLLYDDIGESFFGGINAADVVRELSALDVASIDVRINSAGGDVFDGMAIFNALKRHKARVATHNDGLAASIASVILMAGDTVYMADNAMVMVHNAFTMAAGNANDFETMAGRLRQIDNTIMGVYAGKTGLDQSQLQGFLDAETWLDSSQAADLGFVDEVGESMAIAAHFDQSRFRNWPRGFGAAADETAKRAVSAERLQQRARQVKSETLRER